MSTRIKAVAVDPDLRVPEETVSVIAGYALAIAQALEHCGVDSRRVFDQAGVPAGITNDPLKRLPLDTVTRLYGACVEATGDPCFGLLVARLLHVSTLHALGYGLLASATLQDFCNRVQRYFRLLSHAARVEIQRRGSEVHFRFVLLVQVSAQSQDAWLGTVHRMMRLLAGGEFRAVAAEFAHAMPAGGDAPYVGYFGAPVRFDRDAVALVLPASIMERPLRGACAELAQAHDNMAAAYIARLDRSDVVANVRARIVDLLPSGECSKSRVASSLSMSATTLQQRLAERDTGFHELLSDIRRELACSYLQQSGVSITEIAFLLGFTDVSNFTRAFKRWTGVSPTLFRQRGEATG